MEAKPKNRLAELRASTAIPDLDKLPPSATLNTRQVSLASGFAEYTLRLWRIKGEGKGPRVTYIERKPRYLVRDVRAWMTGSTSGAVAA